MFRSLFILIFIILIFTQSLLGKDINPIWIRTSPADSTMIIVDTSATTTTVLNTKSENGKKEYVAFTEAFKEFHARNLISIQKFIKENSYDGVCNLKIDFNVTNKGYYFLSTYDAFVYKK